REKKIEASIIVEIAPGHGGVIACWDQPHGRVMNCWQAGGDTGGHVRESAARVPPHLANKIDNGLAVRFWHGLIVGYSREEEIETAIAIVIAPSHRAAENAWQTWRQRAG